MINKAIMELQNESADTKRVFIAIPLSEEFRVSLNSYVELYRKYNMRWVAPENWHITLIFLGSIAPSDLARVQEIVFTEARTIHQFSLDFETLCFIPPKRPHLFWARFQLSQPFSQFVQKLNAQLHREMVRAPVPHITLGRLRSHFTFDIQSIQLPPVTVRECEVISSTLTDKGSVYSSLGRYPLSSYTDP
jgi:2'-5' RNA ligase